MSSKDNPLRTLIIIRSHKADTETLAAYDRFARIEGVEVTLCCDERGGVVDPGPRAKVFYNLDTLADMGLYAHANCGWRCGDYAYYVARAARPDYDFYWLIEPDVVIHTADLNATFQALNAGTADLLAARLSIRTPGPPAWYWYQTMSHLYPVVGGCIFPITRLSGRAIDHLYRARRAAPAPESEEAAKLWPNDEVFVATELKNHGFVWRDIAEQRPDLYSRVTLRTALPHDRAQLMAQPPDEQIYHPVRDLAAWIAARTNAATNIGQRFRASTKPLCDSDMKTLLDLTRLTLEHEALRPSALFSLLLMRSRERSDSPKFIRFHATAETILARQFAARHAQDALAIGYRVLGIAPERGGVAAPGDLVLDEGLQLRRLPTSFALPYAFDFDHQTLLCTVHPQPTALLSAPSLHQEQLRLAAVAVSVPWQTLLRDGRTETAAGLTRIVTTAELPPHFKEGWTIPRDPPALLQLDAEGARLKTLRPQLRRALILAATMPYVTAFGTCGNTVFHVSPRTAGLLEAVAAFLPNYEETAAAG
jgi:hypothetical protein